MSDQFRVRVEASQSRRWLGIGMLFFLGALLVYIALATPPSFGWQVFLIVMGGGSVWFGDKMRRATEGWIELTDEGIVDQSGEMIVHMDDIINVERGALAFKPSNGFMLKTRTPASRRWEPGLWWRFGRRIGVGGVTPASQGKVMADLILIRLRERD